MNAQTYISCASGLPRTGDREHLSDMAERDGYDIWTIPASEAIWFVKVNECPGMADVINIVRMYTAIEWNRLSVRFKVLLSKGMVARGGAGQDD